MLSTSVRFMCFDFYKFIKRLTAVAVGYTLFWGASSLTLAEGGMVQFQRGMSINLFPSASPLSKRAEQAMYHTKSKIITAGYSQQFINAAFLAAKHRDLAWSTAQMIINGILSGQINTNNIIQYMTPKMKAEMNTPEQAHSLALVIKCIRSDGNKAKLSTHYTKGMAPDYMQLQLNKSFGQEGAQIAVIDRVGHISSTQLQNQPSSYILIVLSAEKPYEKWSLSGLWAEKLIPL